MLQQHLARILPTDISSENYSRVVHALLRWLCREGPVKDWQVVTKELGLVHEARAFRHEVMSSRAYVSQFWRAVWYVVGAHVSVRDAAAKQGVDVDDLYWVVDSLTADQRRSILEKATKTFILEPAYDAIAREVQTILPYCKSKVASMLTFVSRYDAAYDKEDLANDMLAHGLAAAYKYDHAVSDVKHLRNIAWRSALNRCKTLANFFSRQSRAKIRKVVGAVVMAPSKIFCNSAKTTDVAAFKRGALELRTTMQTSSPEFESVVTSLDAPVTGSDDTATKYAFVGAVQPAVDDTKIDLKKSSSVVQKICNLIMGVDHDASFDAWLAARKRRPTEKSIAKAACSYYGISLDILQREVKNCLTASC